MKKVLACVLAAMFFVFASPVNAQATRTWVSGVGDDVNPCSRTAPCKTFAGAISKTATNGEINCLDPAGYGAVTIVKSIIIDCRYTHGGILAANVNGVNVNGAGIVVTLRGLAINGAGTTTGNGVRITNAAAVNIEDTRIENFAGSTTQGRGVAIETSADVRVTITNSDLYNNNFVGIHSNPSAGNVILVVDNVRVARGTFSGIQLRQNTTATINRATLTNSISGAGITTELSTVTANISNSVLANNTFGVFNGNGGTPTVRLYATVVTGNTTQGLLNNAGSIISLGNNMIRGNAGNEVPTSTITTQ